MLKLQKPNVDTLMDNLSKIQKDRIYRYLTTENIAKATVQKTELSKFHLRKILRNKG